jgi:hypothetical protein
MSQSSNHKYYSPRAKVARIPTVPIIKNVEMYFERTLVRFSTGRRKRPSRIDFRLYSAESSGGLGVATSVRTSR